MMTGSYHYPRIDGIFFGTPWTEVVTSEVERMDAQRVFAVVSGSLLKAIPLEATLRITLGKRFVGSTQGIRAHSPRDDVARIAATVRSHGADLLLAIGGGSVIDAAKVAQLCVAKGIFAASGFDTLRSGHDTNSPDYSLGIRVIAIPTTLSGAEFTPFAGVTDTARKVKERYAHPDMAPRIVILDPRLTVHTPSQLWLSTGIRAVDHAVEDLCSINSQPFADAASLHALRLLGPSLRRTKAAPADIEARLESMHGVWLSLVGTQGGVQKGASHAIGHILGGTAGVPHGFTSCVMLPHVLRWNKELTGRQQQMVSEALGEPDQEAADAVAKLIADLGLPRTLRDVKVRREQLRIVAEHTMDDPWTSTNPRRISGPDDVLDILEAAW